MKTKKPKNKYEYGDALEFSIATSKRHINLEDLQNLAFLINESAYGYIIRKINQNKQNLKKSKPPKPLH
jgi:hypothetical protein